MQHKLSTNGRAWEWIGCVRGVFMTIRCSSSDGHRSILNLQRWIAAYPINAQIRCRVINFYRNIFTTCLFDFPKKKYKPKINKILY
jgi:hypothetical protein